MQLCCIQSCTLQYFSYFFDSLKCFITYFLYFFFSEGVYHHIAILLFTVIISLSLENEIEV